MEEKKWEEQDLTGRLFVNTNKDKSDHKQPSAYGSATIGGKKYRVAVWTRFNRMTGEKYFSLKFEDHEAWEKGREEAKAARGAAAPATQGDDEDLPF